MIPKNRPKCLFKHGEERSIACDCTHEEKINFKNGCYGNQEEPLEVLVNSSCCFTKEDLIFKQAYLASFCFVLFNKLVLTVKLFFQVECFLQALSGNKLILHHNQ